MIGRARRCLSRGVSAAGRHRRGGDTQRGSATVWMLSVAGLVLAAALVGALVAAAVLTRHRAEAAADLAALAAADAALTGPRAACEQARRVVVAGEGTLVKCTLSGAVAEVRVQLRGPGLLARLPPAAAGSRAGPGGWRPLSDGRAATGR